MTAEELEARTEERLENLKRRALDGVNWEKDYSFQQLLIDRREKGFTSMEEFIQKRDAMQALMDKRFSQRRNGVQEANATAYTWETAFKRARPAFIIIAILVLLFFGLQQIPHHDNKNNAFSKVGPQQLVNPDGRGTLAPIAPPTQAPSMQGTAAPSNIAVGTIQEVVLLGVGVCVMGAFFMFFRVFLNRRKKPTTGNITITIEKEVVVQ